MRWRVISLLIIFTFIAFSASARPAQAAPSAPGFSLTVEPHELVPGEAGFVFISGGYPLEVTVRLDQTALAVYWTGEGYLSLFAFGFEEPPGEHQLFITAGDPATGKQLISVETIAVLEYEYPREEVSLSSRQSSLLDPALNQNETDHLAAIYASRTRMIGWAWPFVLPVSGERMTSRFGGNRLYNGGVWHSHHTGIDLQRREGAPIYAAAAGRVVAAETLDVRGNVVILDHGYGVFSQYAHCAELLVAPGQFVQRGQLIASAGETGRTNGPHLHFEIIVNGIPVDPLRWLALVEGFTPPEEVPREPDEAIEEGTGH